MKINVDEEVIHARAHNIKSKISIISFYMYNSFQKATKLLIHKYLLSIICIHFFKVIGYFIKNL